MLLISTVVVTIFHNRFWAPADEGNYAHVAQRLLAGETLHRDVQDVHAGYIDFVNAAAFSLFGVRLVSLRYPLALLTVVQSGLLFLLLQRREIVPAVIAAVMLTSLTFVQFLNPTANWYCLFLTITTIAWLSWVPPGQRWRPLVTGLLLGTTFLFRQLSGVFLGIGVVVFLLIEWPHSPQQEARGLARAVLFALASFLVMYLVRATDGLGWLLFGLWPLPILFHAWRHTTAPNRELATSLLTLAFGALISAVPLIAYHLVHGSIGAWLGDSFGAAISLPQLGFMQRPGYLMMGLLAWRGLQFGDVAARLNAALWIGLLLLTAMLGSLLLRALSRVPTRSSAGALPIIASFYALVSVHYQLPIYLFYTVGLTLAAVLWFVPEMKKVSSALALSAAVLMGGIALYYQAAMPLSRGLQGIVAGQRRWPQRPLPTSVAGLYVDREDAVRYSRLIELIGQETQPGDTIFALPDNAELYFLAHRTNPFKFYNTALGIRSAADLNSVVRRLNCLPPRLVFYNSQDKYNTPASVQIANLVRSRYDSLASIPPFQVFRRRSSSPSCCLSRAC